MADDRDLSRPTAGPAAREPAGADGLAPAPPGPALRAGRAFARTMIRFGRKLFALRTVPGRSRAAIRVAAITTARSVWSDADERWSSAPDRPEATRALARAMLRTLTRQKSVIYRVQQRRPTLAGRRPRILHAIPNVYVGGSTQLMVDLFDHLGDRYEMMVVTSAIPRGAQHAGMPVRLVPQSMTQRELQAQRLADVVAEVRPDIVHVHYWGDTDTPWYADVFAAADARGCAVIQNINTPVAPFAHEGRDLRIYVSNYVRTTFGRAGETSRVVYPGIDLSAFAPPDELDPRAFDSIGMVYRLERDKLDLDAIEPMILAVQRRPRTRAFVIGAGSLFEPFVRRTVEAGVRQNFVFTGAVPYGDLPALYAGFRLFVAPVARESFGQVVPFAMNMGLAVAGNRVGALPEILGGDETLGGNPRETAERIIRLLDDPDRMAALGRRNRELAQAQFGIDGMVRAYNAAYRDVLGARCARDVSDGAAR